MTVGGQTIYVQQAVNLWDGSAFTQVTNNNYESFFNVVSFTAALSELAFYPTVSIIGGISEFYGATYSGNYISNTFRNTSDTTGNKYFLEINGREV